MSSKSTSVFLYTKVLRVHDLYHGERKLFLTPDQISLNLTYNIKICLSNSFRKCTSEISDCSCTSKYQTNSSLDLVLGNKFNYKDILANGFV